MPTESLFFKVQGASQLSQVARLGGTPVKISTLSTANASQWLMLTPLDATGAMADQATAIKLEGTRQSLQLAKMTGQEVTVSKPPMVIGADSRWIELSPIKKMTAASNSSPSIMMKVEGGKQAAQLPYMFGKKYTIIPSPAMGAKSAGWVFMKPASSTMAADQGMMALKLQNGATTSAQITPLMGKTFTVEQAPLMAGNASKWFVLKPALEPIAASSTATAKKVALTSGAPEASAKSATIKAATATGSSSLLGSVGKGGFNLSLSLGMGAWGAVLLVGGVALGLGIYNYCNKTKKNSPGEQEIQDLTS
ncbi:magnetosome protein MamD [Magnetococcus sp. PR-3]|uniref:magnetosome protein MamD n=1 Tax=Magnetococcus sp. PR-3 TaxID=3120355 RepID=UPI002FCE2E3B